MFQNEKAAQKNGIKAGIEALAMGASAENAKKVREATRQQSAKRLNDWTKENVGLN